jgi:soluble lytic murein transglycosylase-like protein
MKKLIILTCLLPIVFADTTNVIANAMTQYKMSLSQESKSKQPTVTVKKASKGYDDCFDDASVHYNVPSDLLKAIARVESKMNPMAFNYNHNGSYDVGIMQINSTWFPKLAKVGIQRGELLDVCKNIQVGAWILSQNIKRYGLTTEAIGRYNSPNPYYKARYAKMVLSEYNRTKTRQISLASNP